MHYKYNLEDSQDVDTKIRKKIDWMIDFKSMSTL